jgi:hypothetical protein
MDVFNVGAAAPKAPESRNVEQKAVQRAAARGAAGDKAKDAYSPSSDAGAVEALAERLAASDDVRQAVIASVSELLGRGLLDTPDAAERAAQGILDS